MYRIFHKHRERHQPPAPSPDDADLDENLQDHPDAPHTSTQFHHGPIARQLILDRIEACRSAAELDSVFQHYGKSLEVYNLWSTRHKRPFYRPIYFRQWLQRCEEYLTIINCPTFEMRYLAYIQYESNPDRPYFKHSNRSDGQTVASRQTTEPPQWVPGKKSRNMSGFQPRFSFICRNIARSLLQHSAQAPVQPTRPGRYGHKYKTPPHRLVASPPWSFGLDWSLQASTPLVEARLAAPTSVAQRQLIGSAWPADWSKTDTIQTRTKLNPELYSRNTLVSSPKGKSLIFLFDLIREALVSGEITTNPPFPEHTAESLANATSANHHVPYQSAALILIFSPIAVLSRRITFFVNPINVTKGANFQPSTRPFQPRLSTYQEVSRILGLPPERRIAEARLWAQQQMQRDRQFPATHFPDLPPEIPGPESDDDSSHSSAFDDDILSSSEASAGSDEDT